MRVRVLWFPQSVISAALAAVSIACLGAPVVVAHGPVQPDRAEQTECVCKTAASSHGWCAACDVGYVASLRIPSALLYELLDPHGHDLDLAGISCVTCLAALESDGFCEDHAMGFVGGRGYVTRLTHLLARGDPVQASDDYLRLRAALKLLDTCEYCALATFASGRCPRCNIHYGDGRKLSTTTRKESR